MNNSEVDAIKGMIEKYKESRPRLTILIMGPGKDNKGDYAQKCYKKRCQIESFLAKKRHTALFPEVLHEEAKTKGDDVPSIIAFEKNLIEQSNQVIMLLIPKAPGLKAELDIFSSKPECATKIHLYYDYGHNIPWHVKNAIDLIEGSGGKTEEFCRKDIERCSLLAKIGVRIDQMVSAISMLPHKKYQGIE